MSRERFVEVNGLSLWTTESGTGLPVLLSNGGPGCCDYLSDVAGMIDDLARIHRWEQRGCGRSEDVGPYTQEACIADMEALRRQFGYDCWIVGGHSWGANLALAYALEHPERVVGLIYLAGTGITEAWKPEYKQAKQERVELQPAFDYPPNLVANRQGNLSRTEYLKRSDLTQRLLTFATPSLIIHGGRDLRPAWPAQQVADPLPHAQFELIEDAEHYLWLTHPIELKAILRRFLARIIKESEQIML